MKTMAMTQITLFYYFVLFVACRMMVMCSVVILNFFVCKVLPVRLLHGLVVCIVRHLRHLTDKIIENLSGSDQSS